MMVELIVATLLAALESRFPDRFAVAVHVDGTARKLQVGEVLEPRSQEAIRHVWLWSSRQPPRKVLLDQLDEQNEEPSPSLRIRIGVPDTLMAWVLRDLIQAQSGEDGGFQLRGLRPAATTLRIDGPGFARRQIEVLPPMDGLPLDVGEIGLDAGATLVVEIDHESADGAQARVDVDGRSLPFDVITPPVVDGQAHYILSLQSQDRRIHLEANESAVVEFD